MNSTIPQFNTKHQKQRMSLPSFSPLLFLVDPPIILARWHRVGPAAGWYRGWWLGCFWECFVSLPMGHRGIVPDDIDVGYPKAKAWIFRKKIWKLPNSAFLTYTPPTKNYPVATFWILKFPRAIHKVQGEWPLLFISMIGAGRWFWGEFWSWYPAPESNSKLTLKIGWSETQKERIVSQHQFSGTNSSNS